MRPDLQAALTHGTPDHAGLPKAVQQYYSEREYLAIGDARRATLQQEETEPDIFEDGV